MAKVEVQVRHCCCCSLLVAAILIGIYTLIVYGTFLGLASWSLWRINTGAAELQGSCLKESSAPFVTVATIQTSEGTVGVVFEPYFDSLGLYTEELKYCDHAVRSPVLIINIIIFSLVIIAAILLFVTLCTDLQWLLLPWIGMMFVDIIRGTISCILIFVYSGGDIRKIAVGIFFLGLQLFHISLVLVIIAFFQQIHDRKRGIVTEYRVEKAGDRSILVDGSNTYPTLPSNYAYSTSPPVRRDGYYQPNYSTYTGDEKRGQRPAQDGSRRTVEYYRNPEGGAYNYSTQHSQARQSNYGRTM